VGTTSLERLAFHQYWQFRSLGVAPREAYINVGDIVTTPKNNYLPTLDFSRHYVTLLDAPAKQHYHHPSAFHHILIVRKFLGTWTLQSHCLDPLFGLLVHIEERRQYDWEQRPGKPFTKANLATTSTHFGQFCLVWADFSSRVTNWRHIKWFLYDTATRTGLHHSYSALRTPVGRRMFPGNQNTNAWVKSGVCSHLLTKTQFLLYSQSSFNC